MKGRDQIGRRNGATGFRPAAPDETSAPRTGQRKKFAKVPSLPLRWPETAKARFDLFDAWHDVAMQIVRRNGVGLHVMAAAKKVIRWTEGVIVDSNADLVSRAGYCSEATIKRELQAMINLGLLISEREWKRPGGGKFITVRRLFPALPETLPEWVNLPQGTDLSRLTRGPDLEAVSRLTRGPSERLTRGPSTIYHEEGGDVAAKPL